MKNIIILLLITFFIAIPQNTNAQNKQLLDVPIDSWAPFRIIEKDKTYGIDFDLLKEIEARSNFEFSYKKYPWTRSLANMKNGKTDLMSGLAKRVEREEYIQYTDTPYFTCSTVFYVKKGNKELIKKYDDLKNHLVGYVANSAYFSPFDTDKTLRKRSVTNETQLIKMLEVGRIKLMIGTDCQVDYDIKKLGLVGEFEKTIYKPNNKVDLYIGISKKSPLVEDIDKINKILKDIIDEGLVEKFAKKYYE